MAPHDDAAVLIERDGAVGVVRLNRPQKLNAFAGEMRDQQRTASKDAKRTGESLHGSCEFLAVGGR